MSAIDLAIDAAERACEQYGENRPAPGESSLSGDQLDLVADAAKAAVRSAGQWLCEHYPLVYEADEDAEPPTCPGCLLLVRDVEDPGTKAHAWHKAERKRAATSALYWAGVSLELAQREAQTARELHDVAVLLAEADPGSSPRQILAAARARLEQAEATVPMMMDRLSRCEQVWAAAKDPGEPWDGESLPDTCKPTD